jgi:two-component system, response regulator PdtaR
MMLADTHPFLVKLWLAAEPPQGPEDLENPTRGQPELGTLSLRVLIVEDEFFISLDTKALLRALGHTAVAVAVSADQAVVLAERERPDVVLMDIRLNGARDGIDRLNGARDGIDAAEDILTRFGIRSIFVTANTDPRMRQRAAAVHPLGFLEKPLTRERLRVGLSGVGRKH